MDEKFCIKCKINKPICQFYKHNNYKDKHTTYCKKCISKANADRQKTDKRKLYMKDYYKKHKPIFIQKSLENQVKNPEAKRVRQRKYSSTLKGRTHHCNAEAKRRAKRYTNFIEYVDRDVLLSLHNNICGICKGFILGDFHIDHIIPLCLGGQHSYQNTQPAHPLCNLKKGTKVNNV